MNKEDIKTAIISGNTFLGLELGSTRIKAVLTDSNHQVIAIGSYSWENSYENGIWTYSLNDVWVGLQTCYKNLSSDVEKKYNLKIKKIGAMCFSAMMHGYLVFDKNNRQLVPFRTWRNTSTEQSSKILTEKFNFNIPQRWSISHLYQAILNKETHVNDIDYITTLAGYVHWRLSNCKILGVGDASGMFPVDVKTGKFNKDMLNIFDSLIEKENISWKISDILPGILPAGEIGGFLTAEGALLLDPTGSLEPGCKICPPEGDAGTGMVATNSVRQYTGNVSAGTSIFAMVVMPEYLSKAYTEIDMVTTPCGKPVAMVHCNNCTSDINAWINIFKEFLSVMRLSADDNSIYTNLFNIALNGDFECGGLVSYNYLSGEPIADLQQGRPLFVRGADSNFNLANFMRMHLFSAMATLKIGMDIITKQENIQIDKMLGHGGLFKTKGVGQSLMAAALNTPVEVMETASEGGAWGASILAAYMLKKQKGESLEEYLDQKVFFQISSSCMAPNYEAVLGFEKFMERYKRGLVVEKSAVINL